MISALTLVLTADCNLRCGYCYANSKRRLHMDWPTLRAALDFGLERGRPGVKLIFSGGEPLLRFPMIERAVAYVNDRAPSHMQPEFVLLTNGTLLDDGNIRFLKKNRFDVQLSFDGVAKTQSLRGDGTFDELDRLLTTLALRHRGFFRRLKVSMTVTPGTVGCMADSVRYFLGKGVERLAIAPSLTDCSGWRPDRHVELKREFARISRASLSHYRRTGKIPVLLFRGRDDGRNPAGLRFAWIPGLSMSMCGIVRGEKLAVDVDGEVSACVTLVGSYQRFGSALLRDAARAARLGNVRSRSFGEKLAGRRERDTDRARSVLSAGPGCPEIFAAKEDKRSSYRSCRECRYFTLCLVCPVSIAHAKGRRNPRRIPDFGCAFSFAAARQWEAFGREVCSSPSVRKTSQSRPRPCRQARTGKIAGR